MAKIDAMKLGYVYPVSGDLKTGTYQNVLGEIAEVTSYYENSDKFYIFHWKNSDKSTKLHLKTKVINKIIKVLADNNFIYYFLLA